MSRDILFKTENFVFSYRVAGILVKNEKVLLQRPINNTDYSIPGGHVSLGETNQESLIREFKEEIGVIIEVNKLKWIGEIFFPWGLKQCHQISLFYSISLIDEVCIPLDGTFYDIETEGAKLVFEWVELKKLNKIELYPTNVKKFLMRNSDDIEHFIYSEEEEGVIGER